MRCCSRRRSRLSVVSGGCVPRSGRARSWQVPHLFFRLGGDRLRSAARRGWSALLRGVFFGRLAAISLASPRPSPSLRFWGGGHCNWSFTFGQSFLGLRYHFLTTNAPSIYSPGGLGSSATVENVVPFHFARCGIRCPPAWSKFPRI